MYRFRPDLDRIYHTDPLWGLPVTRREFGAECRACWLDPERDTSLIMSWLDLHIHRWIQMLLDPDSDKNVEYYALLGSLPYEESHDVLRDWAASEDHLYLIFWEACIKILRHKPKKLSEISDYQISFCVSRILCKKIKTQIYTWMWRKTKESVVEFLPDMDKFTKEPNKNFDWLYEYVNTLPTYPRYLISLVLSDCIHNDMIEITTTTSSWVFYWRIINDYFKTAAFGRLADL